MTNKLIMPSWYRDEFYNLSRSPEEWLYEIWKRYQFKKDEINLPHSIYILPMKEQEKCFIDFIFNEKLEMFLNCLEATPSQPIRYPSVSDVFIMYHQLINTDWYKNHPKRNAFESAISTIAKNGTLSREEMRAFHEMQKTPWCAFHESHQQDNWCPKKEKEMEYLSGIPLSLDPGYSQEFTMATLKKKLKVWIGKLQGIDKQFDRWHESKILAVFDLTFWFKIKQIEYTNIGIHELIWPHGRALKSTELVNPDDDIKHSIKLMNRVIDKSPVSTLFSMCEARKFKREQRKFN